MIKVAFVLLSLYPVNGDDQFRGASGISFGTFETEDACWAAAERQLRERSVLMNGEPFYVGYTCQPIRYIPKAEQPRLSDTPHAPLPPPRAAKPKMWNSGPSGSCYGDDRFCGRMP